MSDKPQALIHVVEDDAAVSRLITATLERFGYRHAAFSTGGDFLFTTDGNGRRRVLRVEELRGSPNCVASL